MPNILCFTVLLLSIKVNSDSKLCQWDCGTDGECYYGNPPGWQNKPYPLELHLDQLRSHLISNNRNTKITMVNKSQSLSYIKTEIYPLYEIYQQQISNTRERFVTAMQKRLSRMKDNAIETMRQIKTNITTFASELNLREEQCEEEGRGVEVAAAQHAAAAHGCLQGGRAALDLLKAYTGDLLGLADTFVTDAVTTDAPTTPSMNGEYLRRVSSVAASVLFELDLGCALARRHASMHLQKLTICTNEADTNTANFLTQLRNLLIQCVYA